jgi:hypothetical protein
MRATNTMLANLNRLCRRRSLIAPTVANATGLQLSIIQGSKTGTSEG